MASLAMLAGSVAAVVFMTAQSASASVEDHSPATWNMQGAQSTLDNKWQLGVRRLISEGHDVIALQETGQVPRSAGTWDSALNRIIPGQTAATYPFWNGITNQGGTQGWTVQRYDWRPNGSRGGNYYIFWMQTDFSATSRVNLAIVTRQLPDDVNVAAPGLVTANVAQSRPALGVRFGNTYFWDLHAFSPGGNDAPRLLENIDTASNTGATAGNPIHWAAMGDFNRAPGTIVPRANQPTYYTYNTGQPTQVSGGELDYMVSTESVPNYLSGSSELGSDHRAVYFGELRGAADVDLTLPNWGNSTVVPDPNVRNNDISVLDANHLGSATDISWHVTQGPLDPGVVTIQSNATGKCIDTFADIVTQEPCDSSAEQQFFFGQGGDGLFAMTPRNGSGCLGVDTRTAGPGVADLISTLDCTSTMAQFRFRFDHDPGDGAAGAQGVVHLQLDPSQDYTVAPDGSATFASVQDAIDAVPADGKPHTIVIQPATYYEPIYVPSFLSNLTIKGSTGNSSNVVISYGNAHGMTNPRTGQIYGTTGSATATLLPDNLTVTGITIRNSFVAAAHPEIDQYSTQAVALAAEGDRQVFTNDQILGVQDTVEVLSHNPAAQTRQYFRGDYITGSVDFIFGNADAVFDRDYIQELDRGAALGGNVVAPNTDSSDTYGILITNSTIASTAQASTFTLARTWHNTPTAVGQLVVRNTVLPAGIVTAAPYTAIDPSFPWQNARFSEYQNSGAGAGVNSNRPQLTDAQAARYTPQTYLAGSDGWNPLG